MAKVKVMIVDDSAVMVKLLKNIISEDPRIDIVATASNGEECVIRARETEPQVILMDLEMPVMNGVEAIRELSRLQMDVAVLAVSAYAKPGFALLDKALEAGAFDFVLKPKNPLEIETIARQIVTNIFVASFSKSKKIPKITEADLAADAASVGDEKRRSVTLIGCSTGGKQSLNQILPKLTDDFKGVMIVLLHLPAFVVKQYIRELGKDSKLPVREIEDGREILRSHIYLSGLGSMNFEVMPGADKEKPPRFQGMAMTAPPPGALPMSNVPSIDLLMESASRLWGEDCQGILLSGNGKDGVKGLRHIQMAKGLTMVEDKGSASVPQLPQAAIDFGSVEKDHVLHVKEILQRIQ